MQKRIDVRSENWQSQFSLTFHFPISHFRYPAQVFVGDTFCYLSGMTFAVVGILGHFSKTLLLFFIPQIINFLYSVPQLFHFVPCPRHRMPKYNAETNLLESSKTQFKVAELNAIGQICVKLFRTFHLIEWTETADGVVSTNNFTLINFLIVLLGPVHEGNLTKRLIGIQVISTCVAFVIRYPLAKYFYEYWWIGTVYVDFLSFRNTIYFVIYQSAQAT